MSLRDGTEGRPARSPFLLGAAWQLPRRPPRRIGLDRTTACDELAQNRVINPSTSEKPRPNQPALRRIRTQRPPPHMRRRALRRLARPQLTHKLLLGGPWRFAAVGATHLHNHTVRPTTDRPCLPPAPTQHVAAAPAAACAQEIPAMVTPVL